MYLLDTTEPPRAVQSLIVTVVILTKLFLSVKRVGIFTSQQHIPILQNPKYLLYHTPDIIYIQYIYFGQVYIYWIEEVWIDTDVVLNSTFVVFSHTTLSPFLWHQAQKSNLCHTKKIYDHSGNWTSILLGSEQKL